VWRIGYMKRKYKNYIVKEDYFKRWSHDMAYVLGFIVADGCLRNDGYYVKIEVAPKDISILEFICEQITPDYELKYTKRGTEVRWYPSSKELKNDLMKFGVIPAKTGKEVVPKQLTKTYLWDFIRGYFDGDGTVNDCCVSTTCNSREFLEKLKEVTSLGYIQQGKPNCNWIIEEKLSLRNFRDNLYKNGSFFFERKKDLMDLLVDWVPDKTGHFSLEEDQFIMENYCTMTRREIAINLGRKAASIKNRMRKLNIRQRGVLSVE